MGTAETRTKVAAAALLVALVGCDGSGSAPDGAVDGSRDTGGDGAGSGADGSADAAGGPDDAGSRGDAGSRDDAGGPNDAGSRDDAGGGDDAGTGGTDNPDGVAEYTTMYVSKDYETENPGIDGDMFVNNDIVGTEWGAGYGYQGSGAWRVWPNYDASVTESTSGWAIGADFEADGPRFVTFSYLQYFSQALMDDIEARNVDWKGVEFYQWNADASARASSGSGGRWVSMFEPDHGQYLDPSHGYDDNGVRYAITSGGAGDEYFYDGTNTNPDWRGMTEEWVWVMHVFDIANTTWTVYYKRQGDPGVSRAITRDETVMTPDGFQDIGHGAHSVGLLFGYWDNLNTSLSADPDKYLSHDRVRVADGWVDPPF